MLGDRDQYPTDTGDEEFDISAEGRRPTMEDIDEGEAIDRYRAQNGDSVPSGY